MSDYSVIYSPEALADLIAIQRYVANAAGIDVARMFASRLVQACDSLADAPHRGTRRDEVRPNVRTIGFRRRVTIAFSVDEDLVTIIGIFYKGRDWRAALQARGP